MIDLIPFAKQVGEGRKNAQQSTKKIQKECLQALIILAGLAERDIYFFILSFFR